MSTHRKTGNKRGSGSRPKHHHPGKQEILLTEFKYQLAQHRKQKIEAYSNLALLILVSGIIGGCAVLIATSLGKSLGWWV